MLENLSSQVGTSEYRLMESIEMDGKLYFSTWSVRGTQLWRTDGVTTTAIYEWPLATLSADYALNKLYVYNNHLLFTGIDSAHGKELWISDGTPQGTHMLKDLYPGSTSAFRSMHEIRYPPGQSNVRYDPFERTGGKMCFLVMDSARRSDLWVTDGTEQGTKPLILFDPYPLGFGFWPHVGVFNNHFYVTFAFGPHNFGLYISDGTTAGTSLLTGSKSFGDYFEYNGKLFFTRTGNNGFWQSDGTASGTFPIDSNIGCTAEKVLFNKRLYFFNGWKQSQLYTSDGTTSGTWLVNDSIFIPENFSAFANKFPTLDLQPHFPVVFQNSIYFCGRNEIWKSDGTVNGTQRLKAFDYSSAFAGLSFPVALIPAGSNMYFKAWDSMRVDVFVTDGTAAGIRKLTHPVTNYNESKHFLSGPPMGAEHPDERMIVYNDQLIFTELYDTTVGKALYKIDLSTTSVNPAISGRPTFTISPNPTSGSVDIRYPEGLYAQAGIFDAIGRSVYRQTIGNNGHDVLDLSGLPPGHYFIQLCGIGTSVSGSVVIRR